MEGHEGSCVVVRNQYGVVSLVDIEEAGLKVLRDLLLIRIRLELIHLLDLFLFGSTLDFVAFISLSELLDLLLVKFILDLLALLQINSLLNILLPQAA